MSKVYAVNEIFSSLQGEGLRAGTANLFLRFSGCNMECQLEAGPKSPGGFDCDTEFVSGRKLSAGQIIDELRACDARPNWIIATGGEPLLQLDGALCDKLHDAGYLIAVESNGSIEAPREEDLEFPPRDIPYNVQERLSAYKLDWITISPKVAEHAVRQPVAHEVKYVRGYGQGIPKPQCKALQQLISPAFNGLELDRRSLAWCIELVKQNPDWRLSVQLHKDWVIR